MTNEKTTREPQPFRARLPGFVGGDDIGLGQAIRRVTYALGAASCGGCERRAAALDRWLVFTGNRRKNPGSS